MMRNRRRIMIYIFRISTATNWCENLSKIILTKKKFLLNLAKGKIFKHRFLHHFVDLDDSKYRFCWGLN